VIRIITINDCTITRVVLPFFDDDQNDPTRSRMDEELQCSLLEILAWNLEENINSVRHVHILRGG
jgi:hypothetical protein